MVLNDDQLRAIGQISVAFNGLELGMNHFARALINPTNSWIGRIVLEGENFDRTLGKVKSLAREVFDGDSEVCSRIEEWVMSAGDVQRRRNEVLHTVWGVAEQTGEIIGFTWLRKSVRRIEPNQVELDLLADDIATVSRDLNEIWEDLPESPRH